MIEQRGGQKAEGGHAFSTHSYFQKCGGGSKKLRVPTRSPPTPISKNGGSYFSKIQFEFKNTIDSYLMTDPSDYLSHIQQTLGLLFH